MCGLSINVCRILGCYSKKRPTANHEGFKERASQLTPAKPKVKALNKARNDLPPVSPTTRGDKAIALAAEGGPERLTKAMEECEAGVNSVNDTTQFHV